MFIKRLAMTPTVARIKNCTLILAILLLNSCASIGSHQAIHESYPKAQAELRKVIESIGQDAMAADIDALQAAHLDSDKFTKFGPRSFQRQNIEQTNKSEAAFFSSIKNLKYEAKDLKIDVFGDIGIATYYPHVSFVKDGQTMTGSGRQTLVFLKTKDGWKLVHEHGTTKQE